MAERDPGAGAEGRREGESWGHDDERAGQVRVERDKDTSKGRGESERSSLYKALGCDGLVLEVGLASLESGLYGRESR